MLPDESIENFGYLKNVSQNHVLVNVVYDMGNYLSGHNSELSTIKDGNNSQKVEPDLETPLFNKKGENSTSDLDVSTRNALEASDEQTTTSSTEKFESSTTKQDSVAVSSTRNYKDQFTEKDDQKTQIDNNNTMETKITTTQENHTSRSSADTISTMKDASVVSSNVIKSSTDVTAITNDVVKKATDQAQDHSDSSPYRTTVLAAEEKRHEIFEKESDKELTRFDCFVAPDEPLTDFTTKRMEDHETNSSKYFILQYGYPDIHTHTHL